MNDRELLEMAARAAGYSGIWIKWPGARHPLDAELGFFHGSDGSVWNPLSSDGDALRLAVKLKLQIRPNDYDVMVVAQLPAHITVAEACEYKDPYAATRRAIVRAAAEIGRGMK